MRRAWLAILVVLSACLASCLPIQSVGRSIWPGNAKPKDAANGPDMVQIHVAPLIAPIGDRYVNEELWTAVDEQILPAATRSRLHDNGLRVGLVASGRTPDGLQQLLTSEKSNPKGNSRLMVKAVGTPVKANLLDELPVCEFVLRQDEKQETRNLEQANCYFELVPGLDSDGKVRLVFTPQIDFDDKEKWSRLNPNLALAVQGRRSNESLVGVRWEVSLALNDYVIVGGRFDKPDSLGFRFFVNPDSERPNQRLLAVRAGRWTPGAKSSLGGDASRSLAAQAASR